MRGAPAGSAPTMHHRGNSRPVPGKASTAPGHGQTGAASLPQSGLQQRLEHVPPANGHEPVGGGETSGAPQTASQVHGEPAARRRQTGAASVPACAPGTPEQHLTGARAPAPLQPAAAPDTDLDALVRDSPFLDLGSSVTAYEWAKGLAMVRVLCGLRLSPAILPV